MALANKPRKAPVRMTTEEKIAKLQKDLQALHEKELEKKIQGQPLTIDTPGFREVIENIRDFQQSSKYPLRSIILAITKQGMGSEWIVKFAKPRGPMDPAKIAARNAKKAAKK